MFLFEKWANGQIMSQALWLSRSDVVKILFEMQGPKELSIGVGESLLCLL